MPDTIVIDLHDACELATTIYAMYEVDKYPEAMELAEIELGQLLAYSGWPDNTFAAALENAVL